MALTWNKPEGKEWIGHTITLLIFILAIYVAVKHYKQPGFWYGVLALFLIGVRVNTSENGSFKSGILDIENN